MADVDRTMDVGAGNLRQFSTAWVVVESSGKRVQLENRVVVGSSEGVDVRLESRRVSRIHAEIALRDDGVWVRDLGSRNGTTIGGVRIESARVGASGEVTVAGERLRIEHGVEERPISQHDRFGPLWGRSLKMRELFVRLARVAQSDAAALVRGETGTGKELAARAIHEASPRAKRPFVVVDCGALPGNLLESELFGHTRGAFTGAVSNHSGAVEVAEEGTIFLDEIGELPLDLQPKLLRALEAKTYRRVGDPTYRPIRARFLTATHRDLAAMVNAGTFREDLFFRLNVLPIHLPPLRERKDDIPLLVRAMLDARGASSLEVSDDELMARSWPGNVRELRSFVERALTLGTDEALAMSPTAAPTAAPVAAAPRGASSPPAPPDGSLPAVDPKVPFKTIRDAWTEHLEFAYVTAALAHHRGNVAASAEGAGLARSYFYRLMQKHGLIGG